METPQQTHICRFFQNFSSVNQIHPGKFPRKQGFFFVWSSANPGLWWRQDGRDLPQEPVTCLNTNSPCSTTNRWSPQTPHSSSPAMKALEASSALAGAVQSSRGSQKHQMPDRPPAPRLAPQLRCQAPGAAPSSCRLLSIFFVQ